MRRGRRNRSSDQPGKETIVVLSLMLALAMPPSICPMTIGVGADGTIFTDRFHGWYEVSLKTLDSDLRGGCYNDANPGPVTSVRLLVASAAPKPIVDSVLSLLKTHGWSQEKVTCLPWRNYPNSP